MSVPNGPSEATEGHDALFVYGESVADALDAEPVIVRHGTIKAHVRRERWVEALTRARDELGLAFFSWLSAVDWSNEVQVGDPPEEEVEERFEVLCTVSDLTDGRMVTVATEVPQDDAVLDSLTGVYAGANWHERETCEMFGIDFTGHPDLSNLYLLEDFEGNPLRKSYPLLSREVKPWPGKVDVEPLPSTENPEA